MKTRFVLFLSTCAALLFSGCTPLGRSTPREFFDHVVLPTNSIVYSAFQGVYITQTSEPALAFRVNMDDNNFDLLLRLGRFSNVPPEDIPQVSQWIALGAKRLGSDHADVTATNLYSSGSGHGWTYLHRTKLEVVMVHLTQ